MNENKCKHCGTKLVEKQTKRTSEQLKKPYYYTAYYFCPHCKRIYHNDKFKKINESPTPLFYSSSKDNKSESRSSVANSSRFTSFSRTIKNFDTEIWTDGACTNNGRSNAKAAWAFVSGPVEKAGTVPGKQTNNRAEALAIYHALVWAASKGYKKLKVYTDSQITLYGLRKPASLVKSNQEIFADIAEVIEKNNLIAEFAKVLGHSGDINNDRADRLANKLAGVKA